MSSQKKVLGRDLDLFSTLLDLCQGVLSKSQEDDETTSFDYLYQEITSLNNLDKKRSIDYPIILNILKMQEFFIT